MNAPFPTPMPETASDELRGMIAAAAGRRKATGVMPRDLLSRAHQLSWLVDTTVLPRNYTVSGGGKPCLQITVADRMMIWIGDAPAVQQMHELIALLSCDGDIEIACSGRPDAYEASDGGVSAAEIAKAPKNIVPADQLLFATLRPLATCQITWGNDQQPQAETTDPALEKITEAFRQQSPDPAPRGMLLKCDNDAGIVVYGSSADGFALKAPFIPAAEALRLWQQI